MKQDLSKKTFFHKRSIKDSKIDWSEHRQCIHNLVRAQSDPYPNAFTYLNSRIIKIKKTELTKEFFGGTPGRIFANTDNGVVVICGGIKKKLNQGLLIKEIELEDGKKEDINKILTTGAYLGG